MDNVVVGDLFCRFLKLVREIDTEEVDEATKADIGRMWRDLIDRRAHSRLPILVVHTMANGSTVPCSFDSRQAFSHYIKTLHPSLDAETDEDAIAWYAKKFASLEIKDRREEMTF